MGHGNHFYWLLVVAYHAKVSHQFESTLVCHQKRGQLVLLKVFYWCISRHRLGQCRMFEGHVRNRFCIFSLLMPILGCVGHPSFIYI